MNIILTLLLPALAILAIMTPFIPMLAGKKTKKTFRNRLIANICMFGGLCVLATIIPIGGLVSAATTTAADITASAAGFAYIGAALSTGLAALGAGFAVASASSAAIGACSEDPSSFGRSLIFVALGEGIALYGLLISILIINSIK